MAVAALGRSAPGMRKAAVAAPNGRMRQMPPQTLQGWTAPACLAESWIAPGPEALPRMLPASYQAQPFAVAAEAVFCQTGMKGMILSWAEAGLGLPAGLAMQEPAGALE